MPNRKKGQKIKVERRERESRKFTCEIENRGGGRMKKKEEMKCQNLEFTLPVLHTRIHWVASLVDCAHSLVHQLCCI